MRMPSFTAMVRIALLFLMTLGIAVPCACDRSDKAGARADEHKGQDTQSEHNPIRVILQEADLPVQKLYLLNKGDTVIYTLPSGRDVVWQAKGEPTVGEQATASGLKAHFQAPPFDELKDYGVSTSGRHEISIYSCDVDGYRVARAEDLRAEHCLPVAILVRQAGTGGKMDHAALRFLFNEIPAPSGPLPRVPIGTVHHLLNEKFGFPVRLILITDDICFQVSGGVFRKTEPERETVLRLMMDYVVEHYEDIDRINQFAFETISGDETVFRYEAHKGQEGQWTLRKLEED